MAVLQNMFYHARILTFLAACALAQSYAHAAEKKLMVGSFENLTVFGDMEVNIVPGTGSSAKASGDPWLLDLLRIERSSDAVVIRLRQQANDTKSQRVTQPLILTLTNQRLKDVTLTGNARIHIGNLITQNLSQISLYGGGSVEVDDVRADKLFVTVNGAGQVKIGGGSVRTSVLEMLGSGNYDAEKLKARKFELDQDGNGTTKAFAEESAAISASGSGNISITGKAECFITKAGSTLITCSTDKKSRTLRK
jgi:Putative auto-transporter adhesin, head GIN domain